jgi:hypothetical protein
MVFQLYNVRDQVLHPYKITGYSNELDFNVGEEIL